MGNRRNRIVFLAWLLLACSMPSTILYAKSVWGSSLIQTTDYYDEYCGALHLGVLEATAVEEADIDKIADNVSPCIVRIHCGDSVGSGMVVTLTEENAVIVSNTHLLQNDVTCKVEFYQGFTAIGEVAAYTEQYDMAFVKVPLTQIPAWEWECLRYVDLHGKEELFREGDAVVQIGSSKTTAGDCYKGAILKMRRYMPEYGTEMLKVRCQAYAGMSGGGVFDNRGYLLGMITGGEMQENARENGTEITYAIPLSVIRQELYSTIPNL